MQSKWKAKRHLHMEGKMFYKLLYIYIYIEGKNTAIHILAYISCISKSF